MHTYAQLAQFIHQLSQIISIPFRLVGPTQSLTVPVIPSEYDPYYAYESKIFSDNSDINYYTTQQFLHFGKVKCKNTPYTIVIGPVSNIPFKKMSLSELLQDFSIPFEYRDLFFNYLSSSSSYSYPYFWSLLGFIYFCINGETFDTIGFVASLTPDDQSTLLLQERQTEGVYQNKDEKYLHNTYDFEREYLYYVETGDVDQLSETLKKMSGMRTGAVASNNIRQEKNLFISSITMVTRAAIRGGMDIEAAYQLSDTTIQDMEQLNSIEMINLLQLNTILLFTNRVFEAKLPKNISPLTSDCIHYIHAHINESVTLETIADVVGYSQSHMAKVFSRDMSISINQYIIKQKIEEAKRLLRFTRKSISEISLFLSFSSQSYFQNTFKKQVHLTPVQFRKQFKNH